MVHLTFFEDIADKAGLIIPTVYLPIVEECTSPHLTAPTPEHVTFLLEKIKANPDDVGEVLRAFRRRINSDDPAVRNLTIQALDSIIRHGTPHFHNELASHKGLLREIENTAVSSGCTEPWTRTKRVARALILNLAVWFVNHPNPNCHTLTTIVTDVKQSIGPTAFNGIAPDHSVRLNLPSTHQRRPAQRAGAVDVQRLSRDQRAGPPSSPPAATPNQAAAAASSLRRERVVDAIPINLPTESSISAMLDTCATLAEYLPNAEVHPVTGAYVRDDVLESFTQKVQEDHSYLATLLSSDLDIDRDVIRSLLDSHAAILQQVREGRPPAPPPMGGPTINSRAKATAPLSVTHRDPNAISLKEEAPASAGKDIYRPRKAATVEGDESAPPPKKGSAEPAAPSLDALFSEATAPVVAESTPANALGVHESPLLPNSAKDEPAAAAVEPESNVSNFTAAEDDDFDDFLEKELGES